jgi:diguanylate cyclase (GGDEF)-like protein
MLRRIHALQVEWRNGNFGVINLDLNGLKTVNDSEGHAAGDQLLVHAAETLTKVFYSEDVFRTGGDEFVVIAGNIDQATSNRKLERLRSLAAKDSKVSFAIGAFWSDGTMDVTGAFHVADEHMYADKEAYYRKHPELRRK